MARVKFIVLAIYWLINNYFYVLVVTNNTFELTMLYLFQFNIIASF